MALSPCNDERLKKLVSIAFGNSLDHEKTVLEMQLLLLPHLPQSATLNPNDIKHNIGPDITKNEIFLYLNRGNGYTLNPFRKVDCRFGETCDFISPNNPKNKHGRCCRFVHIINGISTKQCPNDEKQCKCIGTCTFSHPWALSEYRKDLRIMQLIQIQKQKEKEQEKQNENNDDQKKDNEKKKVYSILCATCNSPTSSNFDKCWYCISEESEEEEASQ